MGSWTPKFFSIILLKYLKYSGEKPQGSAIRLSQMSGNYVICHRQFCQLIFWWKMSPYEGRAKWKIKWKCLLLLRRASPTCSTLTTRTACSGAKSSNMGSTFRSEFNFFLCGTILNICFLIRNNKCGCKGSPTGGRSDWQDERWGKVQPTLVAQVGSRFLTCPCLCNF